MLGERYGINLELVRDRGRVSGKRGNNGYQIRFTEPTQEDIVA